MIRSARMLVLFTTIFFISSTLAGSDPSGQSCSEILSHALTNLAKEHAPSVTIGPQFETSIERFCECKERKDPDFKTGNWLDESFKNPRELFDRDDQCALDTLAKSEYELIFLTQLNLRMMPIIQGRLEERYRTIASGMATLASFNSHLRCLSDKMIYLCARSFSLGTTYQCLHGYLSKARKIDSLERDCPSFQTEGSDMGDIDLAGPRI